REGSVFTIVIRNIEREEVIQVLRNLARQWSRLQVESGPHESGTFFRELEDIEFQRYLQFRKNWKHVKALIGGYAAIRGLVKIELAQFIGRAEDRARPAATFSPFGFLRKALHGFEQLADRAFVHVTRDQYGFRFVQEIFQYHTGRV